MRYIAIPGTWGRKTRTWWPPGSDFHAEMHRLGHELVLPGEAYWTTELQGSPLSSWLPWLDQIDDWEVGGEETAHQLEYHVDDPSSLVVVTHSHAGNMFAHALKRYARPIGGWISVAMPIRDGQPYSAAREYVRYWLNVHGDRTDYMQILGSLGDKVFRVQRTVDQADRNEGIQGGHSDALMKPELFGRWEAWMNEVSRGMRKGQGGGS